MSTVFDSLINSAAYSTAKSSLMQILKQHLQSINGPCAAQGERKEKYEQAVARVGQLRGRELFYKYITSGAGFGPFVELADGSIKYDLITGIGVNFFGHSNLAMFEAMFDGLWCDVMQGNLGPGPEYAKLLEDLTVAVGPKSKLKHAWLTTCGATANEVALKIIRQKKAPASKIFAFKDCFAGRTTALQEITDNAKYREGQPTYGEVSYLPFFNPKSKLTAVEQAAIAVAQMKEELQRYPGRYAAFEFEIIQGEGGFHAAPREFLLPLIQEAKAAGLAIWEDEIQTFGRTGEVFCFQKWDLDEYVDVVTVGKLLQTGAVLYTAEFNPKAGLVSGTFAGASSSLGAASWALKTLKAMSGPQGRVKQLEELTVSEFERLKKGPAGSYLVDYTTVGGMVACTMFRGTLEDTKKFLFKFFDLGAIAFYCGHGPYRVRMLPPFGALTDVQWKDVFRLMEQAMLETARELKL